MIDLIRRLFFALLVFVIAMVVYFLWRGNPSGYGLMDLLQGKDSGQQLTLPGEAKVKPADVALLSQLDDEYTKLAAAVLPSVVSVNTKAMVQKLVQPFAGIPIYSGIVQVPQTGLGSGAIISKEGHVITNYHVVEGAQEVKVTLNDNQTFSATVLYRDAVRDIALLKIQSDRKDFPALSFADSDKTRVGQIVFAVGNPFGLSGTVTQGIISARNRHITDSAMDYLQTDTVINPGNSGGPLVNLRGEILGVNVAIYRGDQNVSSWQGIGLAIPASEAKAAVEEAMGGKPRTGYLGLEVNHDSVRINTGEASGQIGVFIVRVMDNSPAAAAGLLTGDVVTKFNGQPVGSSAELLALIRKTTPGSKVNLTVWRNGELGVVDCVTGQQPKAAGGM
ncbi:MAG: Serine protease Do [Verrucomicrobiaceae bacterium]|nr:Serine protease Do [Verrucomicrobiaceae bacterium]